MFNYEGNCKSIYLAEDLTFQYAIDIQNLEKIPTEQNG
jgi:hypothetical protein